MSIGFVQIVEAGTGFSGNAQTAAKTNTAGNCLIVYAISQGTTNTIGDLAGNTFTQIFNNVAGGENASTKLNLWVVPNCKGFVNNQFTLTTNSGQGSALVVAEYSGVFATPIDVSASSISSSGSPSSPTIMTSQPDWIIGIISSFNDGTLGLTQSSYSARFSGTVPTRYSVIFSDSNATEPAGSYSVSFTNSASDSGLVSLGLTVFPAPTISTQPTNQSAVVGGTATFSVIATGSNLSYQWFVNSVSIPGATSSSYTTGTLTLLNNGDVYDVVVTNPGGSVTSNNATLTVTTGVYSVPDNRNYSNFPNDGVTVQGTIQYTVPSVDSRKAGAPVDSRRAGPPVDSRVAPNIPENSRRNPPF